MMKKKDSDLDILKQGAQLGGGVAAGAGLKSALNSILSGKAGSVAKMLPKALGRGAGAAGIAMAMSPEDVSAGATEVERKLEAGEPLSEDEAMELQLMKDQAKEEMDRGMDEEAAAQRRAAGRREFTKEMLDYESEPEMSEEDLKEMRKEELLKQLRDMGINT